MKKTGIIIIVIVVLLVVAYVIYEQKHKIVNSSPKFVSPGTNNNSNINTIQDVAGLIKNLFGTKPKNNDNNTATGTRAGDIALLQAGADAADAAALQDDMVAPTVPFEGYSPLMKVPSHALESFCN